MEADAEVHSVSTMDHGHDENVVSALFPDDDKSLIEMGGDATAGAGEGGPQEGLNSAQAVAPSGADAAIGTSDMQGIRSMTRVPPGASTSQPQTPASTFGGGQKFRWSAMNPDSQGAPQDTGRSRGGAAAPSRPRQARPTPPMLGTRSTASPPLSPPGIMESTSLPALALAPMAHQLPPGKSLRPSRKLFEPAKYDRGDGRVMLRGVRPDSDYEKYAKSVPMMGRKGFEVRNAFKTMRASQHAAMGETAWSALHSLRASDMPIQDWYKTSKGGARYKMRWD